LSNNSLLTWFECQVNKIETLNIKNGNNTNLTGEFFNASNNPDLYCIVVDDKDYSNAEWLNIDDVSTFKENETDCENLSIVDNDFELDVTIFPNPTDNYLFIEGNVNPVSITIYNLLGAEVIAKSNTDKIDVSELSKGVYIINISDGGFGYIVTSNSNALSPILNAQSVSLFTKVEASSIFSQFGML